jgi:ABC-type transport system involved in multi-copper enzyme maturation permease subunit
VPPEELEAILHDQVEGQRQMMAQVAEQSAVQRATFTYPYSLVLVLGSGAFVMLALILLTATTIGDEFGWATLRTVLVASSHRRRFLVVRFAALATCAILIFGMLLLVGILLPLALSIPASKLPSSLPAFDGGAFLVLLAGEILGAFLVIAFAALVTLVARNGALTLVAALVWVAVEAAVLTALVRLPNFGISTIDGSPPPDAWLLDAFPLRGLSTIGQTVGKAASGLPAYPGDVFTRDPGAALVPFVSFTILIVLLVAASFRRFSRMDIVE